MTFNRSVENDKFLRRLALVWSLFAIVYITAISFLDVPQENIRFVDTVIGFLLGTVVSSIIQFFYGSSLGSKEKSMRGEDAIDDQSV